MVAESSNGREGVEQAFGAETRCHHHGYCYARDEWYRGYYGYSRNLARGKILILTSYLDNEKIYPVLDAGAKGYMLKTSSADEILHAVRKVARGEIAIETEVSKKFSTIAITLNYMMI